MKALVLLLLLVPAGAMAQGRANAGVGGALADLSAVRAQVDRALEGRAGQVGKGVVGAGGLAAAAAYGAYAAFSAVSGDGDAVVRVGVRGDGSISTDDPATDGTASTSTAPVVSTTSTQ